MVEKSSETKLSKTSKSTTTEKVSEKPPKEAEKGSKDNKTEVSAVNNVESKSDNNDYVRGEGQKPVTRAYRNNWDSIFKRR